MSHLPQPYKGEGLFSPFGSFAMIPSLFAEPKSGSDIAVYEDKDTVVVKAAVPGVDPKDIKLNFAKGVLTIQGAKKAEKADKNRNYFQKSSSSFLYHLHIPGNINEKIEPKAEVSHGVVSVSFSKVHAKKAEKKIAVQEKSAGKAKKAAAIHHAAPKKAASPAKKAAHHHKKTAKKA